MGYPRTNWVDGQNKYSIKTQADVVITADAKIVYTGTGGTAVSAYNLNNIELGLVAVSLVGEIKMLATSTVPIGYFECNGAEISRGYSELFAVIGTMFGAGNGTTTFNLPDFRGEFIRGWDNGKGTDPARALGTSQAAANAPHTHTGTTASSGSHFHTEYSPNYSQAYMGGSGSAAASSMTRNTSTDGAHTHTITTDSQGTEARPRNFALMFVIRY